jgi:dTDP-4-amino-4,6-dideoxygalactose transaminase
LEAWSQARRQNAELYKSHFQAAGLLDKISTPEVRSDRDHIFHQYVIRCKERDQLRSHLQNKGIGCEVYYPVSLHEQECFHPLGYAPSDLPCSHAATEQVLALPVYPELNQEQIQYVVSTIAEYYRG